MKRYLIPLLIVLLVFLGFFGYYQWDKNRTVSAWELIPGDAFMVYEATDITTMWQGLDSIKTWRSLKSIPALQQFSREIKSLDSLAGGTNANKGELSTLFENNPILIALFITSAHDFDFLYTLEIKTLEQHTIVSQMVNPSTGNLKRATRIYLGKTITEIDLGTRKFSYIFHKNFFIGSFTPFLVEDAIRTLSESSKGFAQNHQELFKLAKLAKDHGNLYVNMQQLGRMADVFADRLKIDLSALSNLCLQSFLDLRIEENAIMLNGFSLIDPVKSNILGAFLANPGAPFTLQSVVPNNTAHIFHFSFQNFTEWQEKWLELWKNDVETASQRENLKRKYDIDLMAFNQWIGKEIALIQLEGNSLNDFKLVAIATPDIGEAYKQLNVTTERLAKVDADTLVLEEYANREIRELKINELPYLLFGPPFSGFETTYFMPIDGIMVMSNSMQGLKLLLDDIENENTWGKSIKMLEYLATLNKESNISFIANTNRSWGKITQVLNTDWAPAFEQNTAVLKSFETVAVQFSNIDSKFYTNIVLSQPGTFEPKRTIQNFKIEKSIVFPNAIATRPNFGRNPASKALELTLQDINGQFYHVSSDFHVLWSDSLDQQIVTDVSQFDYFKNGKLQFLFASQNKVFGIDRTGEALSGFPIHWPSKDPIQYFSLLDYDKSKNYRLALADTKGNLWLLDKSGNTLEGWAPKSFNHAMASAPVHLRVTGKDMLLVLLANGVVHLVNRKGESYKGFPLDLKDVLSNPIFVETGANFDKTRFTTITDNGEVIQFNANGSILKREQMVRSSAATKFRIVPNVQNSSFIYCRMDENRVGVHDHRGNTLFEKDYISTESLIFQYYNFGSGNEVIAITDQSQSYTYLFDKKGTLINFQPISSDHAIGLMYFESTREYKIYKVYENELALLSVKR